MVKIRAEGECCGTFVRRRGRPVQMDLQAREEAILEAAGDLLSEQGVDHVTMAAIARRAGMSKRTLYEHFDGREALLGKVIARIGETIFRPLALEDTERPLSERLKLLLTLNKPVGSEAQKLEFLRTIIAQAQTYPTLARQLLENGRGRLVGFVTAELLRAVARGEIAVPAERIELAGAILVDMVFEDPIPRMLDPSLPHPGPEDMTQRRDLAIDLFLGGCAAKDLGGAA
ncbi:TetR/AcrR family transcriptional regulator [Celeribacter neptunius]|uniref:Transcriptional regulator, TetR family n=1 Tax=Celeribacter neptunius TaxID=588602 RepID=A0A1I3NCN2_9RHOB|nr:TetR/AcrR family transcriptional regulator [Celeribacter neptunius]SFJ06925.1 transcriptional regulator, TetR family [Celeribacter neptunius]